MKCPYCNKETIWCSNEKIYRKQYGKSYMCYWCKDCDAYVGCHNNTREPLGTMAKPRLRKLRIEAHRNIDKFWKSKSVSRNNVYYALENLFNKVIHIGSSDEKMCRQLIKIKLKDITHNLTNRYGNIHNQECKRPRKVQR